MCLAGIMVVDNLLEIYLGIISPPLSPLVLANARSPSQLVVTGEFTFKNYM